MIYLLAMFVKKRLVNSHTIKNLYVANFANKSASCSRWTSWHRSGSPSRSACTTFLLHNATSTVCLGLSGALSRTCSTPWERTSSQCPTCQKVFRLRSKKGPGSGSGHPNRPCCEPLLELLHCGAILATDFRDWNKCSDLHVELRGQLRYGWDKAENGIIFHWTWIMDTALIHLQLQNSWNLG